jgi:hypothetical protein
MIAEITASALLTFGQVPTPAASDVACMVSRRASDWRRRLRATPSLEIEEDEVFEELAEIIADCAAPNWDGYGAASVLSDTAGQARCFIEALPIGMPMPTISAEPDGHITLEWHRSPRWTLSISVSPEGDLHYAALLGASKAYGSEPFFGDVPMPILGLISRVNS